MGSKEENMTNEDLILLKFYRIADLASDSSFKSESVTSNLKNEEEKELIRILDKIEQGILMCPKRRSQRK